MGVLKTKDIKRSLCKKGFKEENRDHKFYHLYVNNKRTSIRTKISHGKKEVDEFIIRQMAIQTRLTKEQFEELIKCLLTYENYIKVLKEKGHIAV